jgi:hypothetical protein
MLQVYLNSLLLLKLRRNCTEHFQSCNALAKIANNTGIVTVRIVLTQYDAHSCQQKLEVLLHVRGV